MKNWVVVYTKPRHEKSVLRELEKKSFEAYLPLLKKRRIWSDRKAWVKYPLFPSYVFVRTDLNEVLYILQTPGINKLVYFGNQIAIIKNHTIQSVKHMIAGGVNPETTDYFIKGDKVIVMTGHLKGIKGEVIKIKNKDRFLVRVDEIQCSISIEINNNSLKLVK